MPEVRTFTYSPESGPRSPAIHLDVHLPSGPSSSRTVVWFHGGGLLQGTRKNIAPHMLAAVEKEQIVLISVDYRHAPQVRLPDIQSDVARAFNYIVHTLPRLLEAKVNVESVVVTGSSAGGWLALMLALGMVESAGVKEEDRRRIKAVGAIYPITDAGAAWWDGPRSPMIKPLWPDEIYEKMSDPDLPAESNTEGTPQTNPRTQFYHYAQQQGLFRSLLFTPSQLESAWLEKSSVAKFVTSHAAQRAATWPNVYLNHGDVDSAVPASQSSDVASALRQSGFSKTLEYQEAPGRSHMYDAFDASEEMATFWDFIRRQWAE